VAERQVGKCAEGSGGTLFLEEIGELPLPAQVKLLRAIQEREVESVGGSKPLPVDVRLISASNRSLLTAVKQGRFREDLFYRLQAFQIFVPPLREHAEDIPDLVRHFLARFAAEEGKRIRAISGEAMALLCAQSWPGNVRQLENAIFRAVVLAEGDEIGICEFPQLGGQASRPRDAAPPRPSRLTRSRPRIRAPCRAMAIRYISARSFPPTSRSERCRSWTGTATSARWRRSSRNSFASQFPTTRAACRKSPAGCGSAARPSIAGSRSSASGPMRLRKFRPTPWRWGDTCAELIEACRAFG